MILTVSGISREGRKAKLGAGLSTTSFLLGPHNGGTVHRTGVRVQYYRHGRSRRPEAQFTETSLGNMPQKG